jgi:hypothetical protein
VIDSFLRLQQRFEIAAGRYSELKERCEARVVNWRWASLACFDLSPFYFLRSQMPKGYFLRQKPEFLNGKYQYGFDEEGQIIVIRQALTFPPNILFYEEFLEYKSNIIETTLYDYLPEKSAINVAEQIKVDNKVQALYRCYNSGISSEVCEYQEQRLYRILTSFYTDDAQLKQSNLDTFEYDKIGRIQSIKRDWGNEINTLYCRPQKGQTMSSLLKLVEDRIVELILQRISGNNAEPYYCLGIIWNAAVSWADIPPSVFPNSISWREQVMKDERIDIQEKIWSHAHSKTLEKLEDKEFEESYQLFIMYPRN